MRRKDREITSVDEKLKIIDRCKVCRLALSDDNTPYILPLNYGYSFENNVLTLFFHSANEGRKFDIIKKNNKACFEVDCGGKLIEAEKACGYGYEYKSVIGFGAISILKTSAEKTDALNKLMSHQTEKEIKYDFAEHELSKVSVYKMIVDHWAGKQKY